MEELFKRVDKGNDRRLRYEGFCSKCNKITPHRVDGGSLYETRYRCMKCKTINTEPTKYVRINESSKS